MTGRRSHGRLSALNGVVHQGIADMQPQCVDHRFSWVPDSEVWVAWDNVEKIVV